MHISLLQKYHLELLGGWTLSHEKAHLVTLARKKYSVLQRISMRLERNFWMTAYSVIATN